jgi:predicted nucleic acid-binding protein
LKNTLVVDASVAIKWFLPEIHSQEASLVLKSNRELLAPDLIWAEFGSTLRKKVRHKEVTAHEAQGILKDFMRFPLQTFSSKLLLNSAWQLSYESGATIYDSLYLALANNRDCSVVTADKKFYDSITNGTVALKMIWVEDVV